MRDLQVKVAHRGRELRRLGGLAKLAIRTLHMAEAGRLTLQDIRSAIAHLAAPS